MLKCAKCNDFLDGHTCVSCRLRHQCLKDECDCHKYPSLPFGIGSMQDSEYAGFVAVTKKAKWTPKAAEYRRDNLRHAKELKAAGIGRHLGINRLTGKIGVDY